MHSWSETQNHQGLKLEEGESDLPPVSLQQNCSLMTEKTRSADVCSAEQTEDAQVSLVVLLGCAREQDLLCCAVVSLPSYFLFNVWLTAATSIFLSPM